MVLFFVDTLIKMYLLVKKESCKLTMTLFIKEVFLMGCKKEKVIKTWKMEVNILENFKKEKGMEKE